MKCFIVLVAVVAVGQCLFLDDKLSFSDDGVLGDILSASNSELRTRGVAKRGTYESTVNFLFLLADNDRDGKLSAFELAQYTKPKNGNTPLEQARITVQAVDTNGDNKVSKTEMLTYLENNS